MAAVHVSAYAGRTFSPCFPAQAVQPVGRREQELVIDPLLVAPHYYAHPPPLQWDVAEHLNYIQLGSVGSPGARELSHSDLASCAVRKSANGSPAVHAPLPMIPCLLNRFLLYLLH
ncbi:hypothetical protein K466DRAFT_607892 [Polyporus arcularius HHB13444]|uniref:Uncharacterized protein n=1 Tax=Polyporus arcularius HHB13444 TaxID=1314778 RepID=A0A5C3NIT2_9APHY|nr:hypothetical protein K466DRAFT_607892 [Polyporus arcularius HHB13444]